MSRRVDCRCFAAGQAMTELLIAATFVLVPLFLLVPLLGKYIDIRHSTIQAARYEAWEYTVWFNGTGGGLTDDRPGGYPNALPIKTIAEVEAESQRRFFSATALPLDGDDLLGWDEAERNPLWTDHHGEKLWDGTLDPDTLTRRNEPTPDLTGGVMSTVIGIIDTIFEALADAMSLIGDVGFTAINKDGYSISSVAAVVRVPEGLIDFAHLADAGVDTSVRRFDLTFRSQAAVLTDSWNAGGLEHVTNQAGGLVPTKILDELFDNIPVIADVWNIFAAIVPELLLCNPSYDHPFDKPFAPPESDPAKKDGSLWLGYMDIDAVPPDRLDMDGDGERDDYRTITCSDGMCDFDLSGGTYSGPTPYTQGMSKSPCDT